MTATDAIYEQVIRDSWEKAIPELTHRDLRLPSIKGKIDAVIGMRRSGKTYYLYQEMGRLISQGTPRDRILYINFEDERLLPMASEDLHRVTDAMYRLKPALRDEVIWLFLDEVQMVPGWERFARRLLDTGGIKIVVTGSSSRLLVKDVAVSLRGRSLSSKLFPFSFRETLRHQGIGFPSRGRPSGKTRSILENRLKAYMAQGGFPEVQGIEEEHRIRILHDYVDVAVFRDVVERHAVTNAAVLRRMVRHLLASSGCLFSVNKFFNGIRSMGLKTSKDSLYAYLEHLSDAFLVAAVPAHSPSERTRSAIPQKVYAIDTGLVEAFSPAPHADEGRKLESMIFLELLRRGYRIEYLKTKGDSEVNFLVTPVRGTPRLIQSALTIRDGAVREREVKALREAMAGQNKEATIITQNDDEEIKVPEGIIRVVPAWAWLLGIE